MGFRIGSGFIGSDSIQTSVANQEIIPPPPSNWTLFYSCYKFSFYNDQDCTVSVNGGNPMFLRASQGFEVNQYDVGVYSFKILEDGITYNFIGAY